MRHGIAGFFIKRPVLSWVIHIGIILLGLVGWRSTSVREYPKISFPIINVSMDFPGAEASVVESQIANLMEESLSSCEGLEHMFSRIQTGRVNISLYFSSDRSVDSAASDVDNKVRKIRGQFPPNLKEPVISKSDPSDKGFLYIILSGDGYTPGELSDYLYRYIKPVLEPINGVANVNVSGTVGSDLRTFQMNVWLNTTKLSSFKITSNEVFQSIGQQNISGQPAGNLVIGDRRHNLTIKGSLSTVKDFEEVVVREQNGQIIKVKDVANVELVKFDRDSYVKYNGKIAANATVVAQSTANPIAIAETVYEKLKEVQRSIPSALKLEVAIDNAKPIQESISQVYQAIFEAVFLVSLVVLLFLRSWRSTIIPLITIPICLLSGFFIIYLFQYTINLLTLLSMVLATGLVVDDAIVALESIHQQLGKQKNSFIAAYVGMEEIQFSIIAMTLTLVSVYAPIALTTGLTSIVFKEFAITLAGMVCVSGVVALVLTPVMSAYMLQDDKHLEWWILNKFHEYLEQFENFYMRILKSALKWSRSVIAFAVLFGVGGYFVLQYGLEYVLIPEQDQGTISINIYPPSGAEVNYLSDTLDIVERKIRENNSVQSVFVSFSSGAGDASIYVLLKDRHQRPGAKVILEEIKNNVTPYVSGMMTSFAVNYTSFGASSNNKGISLILMTNKSYDELEEVGSHVVKNIRGVDGIDANDIRFTSMKFDKTYEINFYRDKALSLGVTLDDAAVNISRAMRGNPPATHFEIDRKLYPVLVWVPLNEQRDEQSLKSLYVRSSIISNNKRDVVPIRDLIYLNEVRTRPQFEHTNGARSFTIYAKVKDGFDVLKTYKDFEQSVRNVLPKSGYWLAPGKDVKSLIDESNSTYFMIVLSMSFVFLVMAAQFESFFYPLIVMCTVPLALSGALFTLYFVPGVYLNIYSVVGLITLTGLITKHGILIVDFFKNAYLEQGMEIDDAITNAAKLRLKPIIMTTAAMVLGAIPLILSNETGSEVRLQIGWVIVGGLTIGTIFTLIVIPCICSWSEKIRLTLFGKPYKLDLGD